MQTNETSFVITAVDNTQQALNSVAGGLDKLAGNASKLSSALSADLGASPFSSMIKGALDAEKSGKKVADSLDHVGMSAAATAAAMRNVPAQFTDIIVSLQGGQAPLTVLLQQGGQLKDMFGGAGNAAKALGTYVLGLVNPYTLAAAAIGGLSYAYYQGAAESEAFNKTLLLTGDTVGKTAGQLMDLSLVLSKSTGATQGNIADVLNQVVSSGNVAGDMIAKVTQASVDMERAGGPAAAEMVKQFSELGKSPLEASKKLNEQYGYLKVSVYEQIKALQEQGKTLEAAKIAQDAFYDAVENRAPKMLDNLGYVEKSWNAIKNAVLGAGSAIASIGRGDTESELIKKAEDRLGEVKSRVARSASYAGMSSEGAATLQAELAAAQASVDAYKNKAAAAQTEAKAVAESTAQNKLAIAAVDSVTKAQGQGLSKQEQMNKALEAYRVNLDAIKKASPTSDLLDPTKIRQGIAAIKAQYKEVAASGTKNDFAQQYAAELAAEKDFAASQIKLINARVAAGVESEEEGIKETLAAKIAGYKEERETLKALLAHTTDIGKKSDIERQIAAIGTASTVAAAEAKAAFAKIEAAREKLAESRIYDQAMADYNNASSIEEATRAMRDQTAEIGLNEQQLLALSLRRIDDQIANEQWRLSLAGGADALGDQADAIRATIAALDDRKLAMTDRSIANSAKKAADVWDKTSDKIGDSITDALMRGFESGKSAAENLKDSVVNMFKTMVLQPTIKAVVVGGLSAVGMGSAVAADGTSAGGIGGIGNMLSTGSSVYDAISGGTSGLYGTFANSGVGSALGLSTMGASTGVMASTSMGLTIPGVATSSLTSLGATIGAALPMIGLAVAGISLLAGSLHKKTKDTGAVATSTNSGTGANTLNFTGTSADTFDAGMAAGVSGINKSYFDTLNPLLAALGNKQVFSITSDQSAKKKGNGNQYAGFDIGVDGQKSTLQYGFGKVSDAEALAKATSSALGEGISRAISMSDLSGPIKRLFAGVIDQAVVGTMVAGLTKVGNASKELNDVWGISVSQAAEVAMLTGQTQEGIAKTVDAIGTFAAAQRTVGATLETAFASLDPVFTQLTNSALPDNLAAYDAAMKSVDTTVAGGIETFAALFAMREGFAQFRAAIDGLKTSASTAIDAFRTPEERLTLKQATLSDLSTKAGIAVPTSGAALVTMFDSIDFTKPTQAGMNLAAVLPAIAAAFTEVQNAEKALGTGATAASTAMEELRTTLLEHFATAQTLDQAMQSVSSGLGLSIDSLKNMSEADLKQNLTGLITSADSAKLEIINGLIPALDMIAENAVSVAEAAKEKATAIASERQGLQDELDSLTMTSTQMLAKQAEALDATNRPLFAQINAIKALAAASAEAAERMNSAAATFKNAFATDTSKAADLKSSLASLGYKMPKSEAEFIKSVNDLQKTAYSKDHAIAAALTSVSAGYAKDLAAGSADIDKALASGVKSALAGTGITLPKTIDELDALIANISVDGNGPTAKKLADLQNLSPAVVEYFNYLEQHAADVKTASTAAADAIKDAIASARDSLRSISYIGLDQTEVAKREVARLTTAFNAAFAPIIPATTETLGNHAKNAADKLKASLAGSLGATAIAPTTVADAKALAASLDPAVAGNHKLITSLLELANALNTVEEASAAAAKAIADQRDGLQSQLWQSQGNTVALRAKELALIDASNRELQQQIWAIEDQKTALETIKASANDAYSALERAVNAQKKSAQASIDAAQEQVTNLKSIFDNLKSNINTLYGQVDSTKAMGASDGQAFIANALSNAQSSGYMPDPTELSDAVSAAMAGTTDGIYASQVDADRAKLVLAGQMSQLKDVAGTQMTRAEQALKVAQDQLKALDSTLEEQKKLLDAANGIDVSVLSVADAIANLSTAIRELTGAKNGTKASYTDAQLQAGSSALTAGLSSSTISDDFNKLNTMAGVTMPGLDAIGGAAYRSAVAAGQDGNAARNAAIEAASVKQGMSATAFADLSKAAFDGTYQAKLETLAGVSDQYDEWKKRAAALTAAQQAGAAIPKYSVGANVIPNDQFAQVHKGEAIIPAAFNPWLNGGNAANDEGVIAELKALKAEMIEVRKQLDIANGHASRTAKATNGNPDQPVLVEVAP